MYPSLLFCLLGSPQILICGESEVIRSGFLRNPCCAQGAQPNHSSRFTLQASLQLNRYERL